MEISDVKAAIRAGTLVEMTGPPDFTGIRYTVRGVIMRLDAETGGWKYYAELADQRGCITVSPLNRVVTANG